MRFLLLIACLVMFSVSMVGQKSEGVFSYGLCVGASHTSISGMASTFLMSEDRPSYTFSEKPCVVPSVALAVQYRFPLSQIATIAELSYVQTGSRLEKAQQGNVESFDVRLHYTTLSVGLKVYPRHGLNASVLIGAGPCLNASDCLTYSDASKNTVALMQAAEHLRQTVKGRTLVSAGVSLGYDFDMGLSLEAGYRYGLTDLLEVGVNTFNMTDERNSSRCLTLTAGWMITSAGFKSGRSGK